MNSRFSKLCIFGRLLVYTTISKVIVVTLFPKSSYIETTYINNWTSDEFLSKDTLRHINVSSEIHFMCTHQYC